MMVQQGDILRLSDIQDLDADTAETMRSEVESKLFQSNAIEIDLSRTQLLDSSGLGGLVSVHKLASTYNGGVPVRVINPTPAIQQLLELTRLHRLFEIVDR